MRVRPGFLFATALGAMLYSSFLSPSAGLAAVLNCSECHTGAGADPFVHPPFAAGECSSCHQFVKGKQHPDDGGAVVLVEPGAKLCYQCHDVRNVKKYVHAPVASGNCVACHNPHSSVNAGLLKNEGAALCLSCHKGKFKHKVDHAPVAAGNCLICHDPHQSDNRKLLKLAGATLCFSCHDSSAMTGKSVHPPVAKGDCVACHAPHGSDYRKLLRKFFPQTFYMSYNEENFALCFECHNREIALDKRTGTITNFRDGDRNLHTLHVNMPDKGRSCKVCHDPHAASQAKLIKGKVPGFGNWEIPISYEKTSTGGTCVVGCHKPRSYDRNRSDED